MSQSSIDRLLTAVWGNRKGYVFLPHKDTTSKREWHETPGIPINGKLPKLKIPDRSDVYFCPVVFSKPRRKGKYALPTNLLWSDLDAAHPDDCRVRPSVAWESSPGRFQALWFLNQEVSGDEAAALSKRIAYADGADKSGWDLTQVLRLPGTKNYKYPAAPEVRLLWAKRSAYSPSEIKKAYPSVNAEAPTELGDWPEVSDDRVQAAIAGLSVGLKSRIRRDSVLDRSQEMQKLARDLLKAKVDRDVVVHILQRVPYNKFAGRGDEQKQLLLQVSSAEAAVRDQIEKKQQKEQKVRVAENTADFEEMEVHKWNDFLAIPTKLQWLVEDSWIDGSVGFISGRSKSYKTWIALDLMLSIVSGKPFLNQFTVGRTGPVILIQEEDPSVVLQERLKLIANSKDMLPTAKYIEKKNIIRLNYPDWPIYIINLQGFNLQRTDAVDQVRKLIAQVNPVMVILDPLVVMLGNVDEYRASEVSGLLQSIKMWREEFGCSVAVVHHWNKAGAGGDNGERGGQHMYGSFAFHAWLESALHVAPIIEEADARIDTVIIEREFKAAPSGRSLKVRFDIDSVDRYIYEPILEQGKITVGHMGTLLDLINSNPGGMTSKDLMESTGFSRSNISENMGKLVRAKKVKRQKGGGRGVQTVYFPIND